jgi:hypothetical protein
MGTLIKMFFDDCHWTVDQGRSTTEYPGCSLDQYRLRRRRASINMRCNETVATPTIVAVREPQACVYELDVESASLCGYEPAPPP